MFYDNIRESKKRDSLFYDDMSKSAKLKPVKLDNRKNQDLDESKASIKDLIITDELQDQLAQAELDFQPKRVSKKTENPVDEIRTNDYAQLTDYPLYQKID